MHNDIIRTQHQANKIVARMASNTIAPQVNRMDDEMAAAITTYVIEDIRKIAGDFDAEAIAEVAVEFIQDWVNRRGIESIESLAA